MKKTLLSISIIILIISAVLFVKNQKKDAIDYRLESKTYHLLVADQGGEWEQGLMNRSKLENAEGMIFIFPDKNYRSFWNKNTHLDLDLYWLNGDHVVGKSFLPAIEKSGTVFTVKSPERVNKVIELVSSQ